MPELPEVTTTVNGLNEILPGLTIKDVWSDYFLRTKNKRKDNIKNKKFFEYFRGEVMGKKIKGSERRGKNVLIHLDGNRTILVHMKMTGHFLYGKYKKNLKQGTEQIVGWEAVGSDELKDPFNRFIHLIFTLSNGKHLAFSDMRKFAKIILFETDKQDDITDLSLLGPEPLSDLSVKTFQKQLLKKPSGKIKTVLMDQTVIAGIGNIYSDEILWQAGIHPERKASDITGQEIRKIIKATKKILTRSIKMGGDSMSDYRNIHGQRGHFQNAHKAYRRTKQKCLKKGCDGFIIRKIINGRSAHFCNTHQK